MTKLPSKTLEKKMGINTDNFIFDTVQSTYLKTLITYLSIL